MTQIPQPSPIPRQIPIHTPEVLEHQPPNREKEPEPEPQSSSAPTKRPHVKPARTPLLRLEIRDLSCDGARSFLKLANVASALQDAVTHVLDLLYMKKSTDIIPPTRSVTLIVRDMEGVAYTTGTDLDSDHKEIHLSTQHIAHFEGERCAKEIMGVLVHEMVHAWQWNGKGSAPDGLIEGIADFVRLRAGLAPPHWHKVWKDCDWDVGYERTGYFLDWLESEYGAGTVRLINARLMYEYEAESFWKVCCGSKVEDLWKRYGECMDRTATDSQSTNKTDDEKGDGKADGKANA